MFKRLTLPVHWYYYNDKKKKKTIYGEKWHKILQPQIFTVIISFTLFKLAQCTSIIFSVAHDCYGQYVAKTEFSRQAYLSIFFFFSAQGVHTKLANKCAMFVWKLFLRYLQRQKGSVHVKSCCSVDRTKTGKIHKNISHSGYFFIELIVDWGAKTLIHLMGGIHG